MKPISQVAKECGVSYELIFRIAKRLEIDTKKETGHKLDKYQEDIIHNELYFGGYFQFLTLESKMNYL